LSIVVWEQQDTRISQENIDINNISGHESPPITESACVDEQSFFLSIFMILEIGIVLITKVRDVSVMFQKRLNGLIRLCIEKQLLDDINY
jgi:hypothetical protein